MATDDALVLIRYRALPGHEEEAARELAALIATVLAEEPDCHGITLLREQDDAASLFLVEWWASREAYSGPHLQTPHLNAFRARAASFFSGPPEITFWDRLPGR
jgi:quinol monooxygenase YgiN